VSATASEPLGSAAEEAARLIESLQGWFGVPVPVASAEPVNERERGGADRTDRDTGDAADPDIHEDSAAGHGPACRACPLCRGIAAVQQSHPEVLTHLAGAAQHLVAALRSLAAEPARAAAGTASGDGPASGEPPASGDRPASDGPVGRPSRAVRIDVEPDPHQQCDDHPGQDGPGSGPSEEEPAP
jgi:hypothetical protein